MSPKAKQLAQFVQIAIDAAGSPMEWATRVVGALDLLGEEDPDLFALRYPTILKLGKTFTQTLPEIHPLLANRLRDLCTTAATRALLCVIDTTDRDALQVLIGEAPPEAAMEVPTVARGPVPSARLRIDSATSAPDVPSADAEEQDIVLAEDSEVADAADDPLPSAFDLSVSSRLTRTAKDQRTGARMAVEVAPVAKKRTRSSEPEESPSKKPSKLAKGKGRADAKVLQSPSVPDQRAAFSLAKDSDHLYYGSQMCTTCFNANQEACRIPYDGAPTHCRRCTVQHKRCSGPLEGDVELPANFVYKTRKSPVRRRKASPPVASPLRRRSSRVRKTVINVDDDEEYDDQESSEDKKPAGNEQADRTAIASLLSRLLAGGGSRADPIALFSTPDGYHAHWQEAVNTMNAVFESVIDQVAPVPIAFPPFGFVVDDEGLLRLVADQPGEVTRLEALVASAQSAHARSLADLRLAVQCAMYTNRLVTSARTRLAEVVDSTSSVSESIGGSSSKPPPVRFGTRAGKQPRSPIADNLAGLERDVSMGHVEGSPVIGDPVEDLSQYVAIDMDARDDAGGLGEGSGLTAEEKAAL